MNKFYQIRVRKDSNSTKTKPKEHELLTRFLKVNAVNTLTKRIRHSYFLPTRDIPHGQRQTWA
jgi:hypothetical protein